LKGIQKKEMVWEMGEERSEGRGNEKGGGARVGKQRH